MATVTKRVPTEKFRRLKAIYEASSRHHPTDVEILSAAIDLATVISERWGLSIIEGIIEGNVELRPRLIPHSKGGTKSGTS